LRFIETNIFLYVITAHPEFGPVARRILERIDSGEQAMTSSLAIAEVCAWLEYHKRKTEVETFLMLFKPRRLWFRRGALSVCFIVACMKG
jgi:predicted nucleic acid-binding protein